MKINRLFLIAFVVLLALVVVACERSASTPVAEPTFPIPDSGTSTVGQELLLQSTQTAQAEISGGQTGEIDESAPASGDGEPQIQPAETEAPPAPVETQAPVAPQTYSVPDTYTLQGGEFPYCIARRFNINADSLMAVNGLNVNSVVYPGHVLTIPKDAGPFVGQRALRSHGSYTVQAGDTVYSIACLFGDVDPRAIEASNSLTGAYSLNVGTSLIIP